MPAVDSTLVRAETGPGEHHARPANIVLLWALTAALLSGWQGCAPRDQQDAQTPVIAETEPALTPEVVKFGNVITYPRDSRIEVEAVFCLEEGILEYLAVAKSGKTYESVLELNCEPSKLHAALLALGCEPGDVPEEAKGDFVGAAYGTGRQNSRSYLDIFVEWTEGNETVRVRAEELLRSIAEDKPPGPIHWVFTGSYFAKDREGRDWYSADLGRSIIAVWYDPSAVINLPLVTGNPYRGASGFAVNTTILPTAPKAKLIIEPHRGNHGAVANSCAGERLASIIKR